MNHREQRITEAIIKYGQNARYDLSGWPEDVRATVTVVCELWNHIPPATKSSKSYWILSARELVDACGEFGVEAIRQYRKTFEDYMSKNNGLPPFPVEGPGALIKSVRTQAAQMRDGVTTSQRAMRQDERSRRRYGEES